jgi:SAM-dependent methyltransferase
VTAALEPATQDQAFDVLVGLNRYTGWIASILRPWMRGRFLEIGAGIGNLTRYFLEAPSLTVVDVNGEYLAELTRRYAPARLATEVMDVTAPVDPLGDRVFDTILMVNVLEHLEDHESVLRRVHRHLAPDGHLLLLVPAHPALFGGVDREAGHVRRYERRGLAATLGGTGFEVVTLRYFNMLGALGWWVNIRLLGRRYLPSLQARLLEWLVPVLRLEDLIAPPFGLSLIAVARRP